MTTKRKPPARRGDRRPGPNGAVRAANLQTADASPSRPGRRQPGTAPAPGREPRPRSGPQNTASSRPDDRPTPPTSARQAKARAKARKAKAPKVVRVPLRDRLIARLASVDLRPRTLAAKVPFVVLVIGSLGLGLGITLWLSTDSAEGSYQLGGIREENRVLLQQKEALERDVLTAQSAPALAEAARNLGMIPTRDTAHLIQDPAGNWVVVGSPKPAEGVPPPPLNTKLPDEQSGPPAAPPVEVPVRVPPADQAVPGVLGAPRLGPEVLLRTPDGGMTLGAQHLPAAGPTVPGPSGAPLAEPAPVPPGPPPVPPGPPPASSGPPSASIDQFAVPPVVAAPLAPPATPVVPEGAR